MDKLLELDDRFSTGEPTVVMVATSDRGKWFIEKTASPAFEYIKHVEPRKGKTIVLVNAMGAFETYDDNRNGDGFPAKAYRVGERTKCGHAECNPDLKGWIAEPETLIHHYKTFEKHGGIYRHHVNKDPSKSRGKIEQAFWNDRMQRVELLLEIENEKDAELTKKIQDGEFPAVSMGCHVKYDVCTICGHRAPTRKDYCEHARFKLRQIDKKTGEKIAVLNPSPRFFDISFVFRPADPTGFMMKKVAHAYELRSSAELGEKLAEHATKRAEVRKISDIQKEIVGRIEAAKSGPTGALVRRYRDGEMKANVGKLPRLTDAKLAALADYSFSEVVSTLASKNAALATGEFVRLFVHKTAHVAPSHVQLDRVVALQPLMMEILASYPDVEEKLAGLVELDASHVRPELSARLGSWLTKRAGLADYVSQAIHQPGAFGLDGSAFGPGYLHNASEPPKTDLLTMTDPHSGQVYETTRGAGMASHNNDVRASLMGGALLGALYYRGLGRLGLNRRASAMLAAPAGYVSARGLVHAMNPYRNPTYMSDQGVPLSGGTEFVKAGTAALDFGAVGLLNKAALDYAERVGVGDDMDGALRRELRGHSPRLAAWLGDGQDLAAKVASLVADLEVATGDPTSPAALDLDRLAHRLSNLAAD